MSQLETVSTFETARVAAYSGRLLQLRFRRGQLSSSHSIGESTGFVGAVAEWFVCGMPTAAKTYDGTSRKTERLSLRINDLEVSFYPDRPVVIDCYFRGRHFFSRRTRKYAHTSPQPQAQMHPPTPASFCEECGSA